MGKDAAAQAAAALLMLTAGARAEMRDAADMKAPAIEVTGIGSVHAAPDIATIRIGVTSDSANAQQAVSHNNEATAKVMAELAAASIDRKDLKTSNYSLYPQYRTEGEPKHQVLTYHVSNTVTATVRDIAKVGEILTEVVAAGSNQINGLSFSVSNPEKYLEEARKKAVENAMEKAKTYASAAGLKTGAVLQMAEGGSFALLAPRGAGPAKAALACVPIEAGEESIEAQIVLVIELKQ
jgi:uncharacterized protein YggE